LVKAYSNEVSTKVNTKYHSLFQVKKRLGTAGLPVMNTDGAWLFLNQKTQRVSLGGFVFIFIFPQITTLFQFQDSLLLLLNNLSTLSCLCFPTILRIFDQSVGLVLLCLLSFQHSKNRENFF